MFDTFERGKIVIHLDGKVKSTEDVINEIINYFKKQESKCRVIEKTSIPIIEVDGKKYYAGIKNKLGAAAGEQYIVLTPYKY